MLFRDVAISSIRLISSRSSLVINTCTTSPSSMVEAPPRRLNPIFEVELDWILTWATLKLDALMVSEKYSVSTALVKLRSQYITSGGVESGINR